MTPVQLWVSGQNNLNASGALTSSVESNIDAYSIMKDLYLLKELMVKHGMKIWLTSLKLHVLSMMPSSII